MADPEHGQRGGCGSRWRAAALGAVAAAGVVVLATAAMVVAGGESAWADSGAQASTEDLREVVTRLRNVIVALASAVGTLFLTIAGLRWMLAGGDPSQVEAAKKAMSGAAVGYGVAILATVLMTVLDYIVQGG